MFKIYQRPEIPVTVEGVGLRIICMYKQSPKLLSHHTPWLNGWQNCYCMQGDLSSNPSIITGFYGPEYIMGKALSIFRINFYHFWRFGWLYPIIPNGQCLCVVGAMRGWLRDVDQFIPKFLIFFMHIYLFFNHVLYLYPFQISKLIMKCWNN